MPHRSHRTTRRTFFMQGAAAAGVVATSSGSLLAASANAQVRLAVIGCGWRGGQLLDRFAALPTARIAGLADPDEQRLGEAAQKFPDATAVGDFRELLDDPAIDAVVIAACNHWHGLATIWALQAGKHVYVEKPLTNTFWEGEQVVKASQDSGKICQIGTQQRSDAMQEDIKEFLHAEAKLGKVQWVRVNRFGVREPIGKRTSPLPIPARVNYDLWLGPAEDQPLYRDALHYDWHWDWNTGAGEMGNWGVHILDDVRNNVFLDRVAVPTRVAAFGGRCVWDDAGNTPNVLVAALQAGDVPVLVALTNLPAGPDAKGSPSCPGPSSGYVAYCEGGRLEGERGKWAAFDADGKRITSAGGGGGEPVHQQAFLDAIRHDDPQRVRATVAQGHYSTAWCTLPNAAYRAAVEARGASGASGQRDAGAAFQPALPMAEVEAQMRALVSGFGDVEAERSLAGSVVLDFDTDSQQFTGAGASQANRYLRPTSRPGYELPTS